MGGREGERVFNHQAENLATASTFYENFRSYAHFSSSGCD